MLKLQPVALTDVGRKRTNNQDHLGDLIFKSGRKYGPEKLEERGHLFAVADGMGGYAGGEVASELAITSLFERFYNGPTSGDTGNDLRESIRQANFEVHKAANETGRNQMGTTLTLVLVKGNRAIFGNVGDSRTYLIRQGLPERVTHDHSLVQDQIDAGVLTPEQAERSSIRNFITRAIGHRDDVESDLFERELQTGDVLLLCSDGLHGLVKEIEMGTIVATTADLQEAAQTLLNLANERGGPDNISVMLVRVDELGQALPPILKTQEPNHDTVTTFFDQKTAQLSRPAQPASLSDQPTIPGGVVTPVMNAAVPVQSGIETKPTVQMRVPNSPPSKPGGRGLLFGILALLVAVVALVGAVIYFSNSSTSPATAVPTVTTLAATPTATTTAAATPSKSSSGSSNVSARSENNSAAQTGPDANRAALPIANPTPGGGNEIVAKMPRAEVTDPKQITKIQLQIRSGFDAPIGKVELQLLSSKESWTAEQAGPGVYQLDVKKLVPGNYQLKVFAAKNAGGEENKIAQYDFEVNEQTLWAIRSLPMVQQSDTLIVQLLPQS